MKKVRTEGRVSLAEACGCSQGVKVKFTETERSTAAARAWGWGRGAGKSSFPRQRVSVWEEDNECSGDRWWSPQNLNVLNATDLKNG